MNAEQINPELEPMAAYAEAALYREGASYLVKGGTAQDRALLVQWMILYLPPGVTVHGLSGAEQETLARRSAAR